MEKVLLANLIQQYMIFLYKVSKLRKWNNLLKKYKNNKKKVEKKENKINKRRKIYK